jgi:hypothetical protein
MSTNGPQGADTRQACRGMPSNGDEASNGLRPSWSRWSRPWALSERRAAATSYVPGLLMPGQRKPIEPMAARLGVPSQRLQQLVTDSPWDEHDLWRVIRHSNRRSVKDFAIAPSPENAVTVAEPKCTAASNLTWKFGSISVHMTSENDSDEILTLDCRAMT